MHASSTFRLKFILRVVFNGWDLECRSNERRQSLSLVELFGGRGRERGRSTISRVTSTTSHAHRRPNRGNTPTPNHNVTTTHDIRRSPATFLHDLHHFTVLVTYSVTIAFLLIHCDICYPVVHARSSSLSLSPRPTTTTIVCRIGTR